MDIEEYKKRVTENEDWAPGWDAIDSVFDMLYPQKNQHILEQNYMPEQSLVEINT